ncbi:MAG: carboxypeptidase-like regulatory domain-containing protein, partial [Bryobacteraceae bacterium]
MPDRFVCSLTLVHVAALGFAFVLLSVPLWGQHAVMPPTAESPADLLNNPDFELDIFVRDQHGNPLDAAAAVHLSSARLNYNAIVPTQGASAAHFFNLGFGEYEVEVTCPGFRTVTERYASESSRGSLPLYIYLSPESGPADFAAPSGGLVLTQQLRAEMQEGLEALNKDHYESARKAF